MELRTNAHKLLWEAVDYAVSVEADAFIPGFDRDGKGHPNFAGLVMGHRLYQSAATKTFRPDRKEIVKLLEKTSGCMYQANHTWFKSVRSHLDKTLLDGITEASTRLKPLSFLSHPVPECSCARPEFSGKSSHASSPSAQSRAQAVLRVVHRCPTWMDRDLVPRAKEMDGDDDLDIDEDSSSGFFSRNSEGGEGEMNKEESEMEDQELEGGER